jgi:hypothetical protein
MTRKGKGFSGIQRATIKRKRRAKHRGNGCDIVMMNLRVLVIWGR